MHNFLTENGTHLTIHNASFRQKGKVSNWNNRLPKPGLMHRFTQ